MPQTGFTTLVRMSSLGVGCSRISPIGTRLLPHNRVVSIEKISSEVHNFLKTLTQGYELNFSKGSSSMRTRTNWLRTPIRVMHKILEVAHLGRNRPELRCKRRVQKSLLQNLRTLSRSVPVCADLLFATLRLRFSGLEPPASRFFVSNTGCFFMPTLASPPFCASATLSPPRTRIRLSIELLA